MKKIRQIVLIAILATNQSIIPVAFATEPVTPAPNQAALLTNSDPQLAANKRLVYDFWRIVLVASHLDQAAKFLREDYIQHNPNVPTGLQGFLDYFGNLGRKPTDIVSEIEGLVTIHAEGDFVILALVDKRTHPTSGETYTTTWFDMFRIEGGKIAEHWDVAHKR